MIYDLWFMVYCIVLYSQAAPGEPVQIVFEHNGQSPYPIQNEAENGMSGFRQFGIPKRARRIQAARGAGLNSILTICFAVQTQGTNTHILYGRL